MVLFDPKGPIGEAERFVIITAFALMLIVVIPVFIMAFWFSRKYRASNTKRRLYAEMGLFRQDRFGRLAGSRCHRHGSCDIWPGPATLRLDPV